MRQRRDKEEEELGYVPERSNGGDEVISNNGNSTSSRRRRRRSRPHPHGTSSKIALAPWNMLLPNLFLLFVVLFGMGTILLHSYLVHQHSTNNSSNNNEDHRSSSFSSPLQQPQQQRSQRQPSPPRINRHFLQQQEKQRQDDYGISKNAHKKKNKQHDSMTTEDILDNEFDPMSPFYDPRTWYRTLRESFEASHHGSSTPIQIVEHIKTSLDGNHTFVPTQEALTLLTYNVHDCPYDPPKNYPQQYSLVEMLSYWNPDNVTMPTSDSGDTTHPIYMGLCIFDYTKNGHYAKSLHYRELEVPYVIRFHPSLLSTVMRWNHPDYMNSLLKSNHLPKQRTESSPTNHFMFWRLDPRRKQMQQQQRLRRKQEDNDDIDRIKDPEDGTPYGWQAPTENIEMTYEEWLVKANVSSSIAPSLSEQHYYFRLNGCPDGLLNKAKRFKERAPHKEEREGGGGGGGKMSKFLSNLKQNVPGGRREGRGGDSQSIEYPWERCSQLYLFDELPFFAPGDKLSKDYLIDPTEYRGINCRFGMTGAIAENHFDMSRNFITVLKGHRRYILSHPNQCSNMALYPKEHPSGRHSIIDWSDYERDSTWQHTFPNFYNKATANEVVLQAGDTLYLPTNWMHYIISLDLNYQCNARSGRTSDYDSYIRQCGFI